MKFKNLALGELFYKLTYTNDQTEYLTQLKDQAEGFGFRLDGLGQIPHYTLPKGYHPELIKNIINHIALGEVEESQSNLGLWYYCTIHRVEKTDD